MCLAKHLAVAFVCGTAFAPCFYMVGIHVCQFPYLLPIYIMTYGA